MEDLYHYAAVILNRQGEPKVVRHESEQQQWLDQAIEVHQQAITYHFDNGVVIRRTMELDDDDSDLLCGECWITYEVLSNDHSPVQVMPQKKSFDNPCRERFWLSYHAS